MNGLSSLGFFGRAEKVRRKKNRMAGTSISLSKTG